MKGKILDYKLQDSKGIISGEDGNRYEFNNSNWRGDKLPKVNQTVDFIVEDNMAKDIYVEISSVNINTDELKDKFNNIKNSEQINSIITNGNQNIYGFSLTIAMLIAFFLPLASTIQKLSFIDLELSTLAFISLIGIAFLFYTGLQDKLLKILVIVVSIFILFTFVMLLTDINDINNFAFGRRNNILNIFDYINYGSYILIPLTIAFLINGLKLKSESKIEHGNII